VVNARFVKPLDKELLSRLLANAPRLITVEDHVTAGGFGSAVLEFLADEGISGIEIRRLGIPDRFIPHGTQDELRKLCGFDKDAIAQTALQMVRRGKKRSREGWERGSA
jgi:1-deoxy-D-xylulose-5-phosphate synthase